MARWGGDQNVAHRVGPGLQNENLKWSTYFLQKILRWDFDFGAAAAAAAADAGLSTGVQGLKLEVLNSLIPPPTHH